MSKRTKRNSRRVEPYTICDVEKAIQQVKNKGSSILAACKQFNIPYATLHSRVTGKYPVDVRLGPPTVFSAAEEKELVDWIIDLSKQGFPVTKQHLIDSVQNIVIKTNRKTAFTNGRPSKHWFSAFMRRNPQLSGTVSQSLNKARAAVSEDNLKNWFNQISEYFSSNNIQNIGPERIFNLDESAFLLNPKCGRVLVRKGEKSVYNVCNNDKECYTALIGGNAAGLLLPVMIIYSYERIPPSITQNFPDDFVLGRSESGWMTSETFFSYIANHFYPWCLENNIEFPIILYVDGHSSHVTKAVSEFCIEKNIVLIALFPNATHILQPMDVSLFHPLKCAYKTAVRIWRMDNDGQCLKKIYFPSVLKSALHALDLKKIFNNGFAKCGLYPFTETAIDYGKLMKTCKRDNVSEQTNEQLKKKVKFSAISYEESKHFLEMHIDQNILNQFKNNKSNQWSGDIKYTELYNVWMKCRNSIEFIDLSLTENSTNNQLNMTSGSENIPNLELIADVPLVENNVNLENIIIINNLENISEINESCATNESASISNHKVIDDSMMGNTAINKSILMSDTSSLSEHVNLESTVRQNSQIVNAYPTSNILSHRVIDILRNNNAIAESAVMSDTSSISNYANSESTVIQNSEIVDAYPTSNILKHQVIDILTADNIAIAESAVISDTSSISNSINLESTVKPNSVIVNAYTASNVLSPRVIDISAVDNEIAESHVISDKINISCDQELGDKQTSKDVINLNNAKEYKEAFSNKIDVEYKDNIKKCSNVSKSLIIKSVNMTGLNAESASGSSIKPYLFYPEAKNINNNKRKKYKEKLPTTLTSPEWIALQNLKAKDKEEKEQKKANIKLILMKKTDVQKRITKVQQNLKQKKANMILMEIEYKDKDAMEEKKLLAEKIKNLKELIQNEKSLLADLLQDKHAFILEEKKLRSESCKREPLKTLNI